MASRCRLEKPADDFPDIRIGRRLAVSDITTRRIIFQKKVSVQGTLEKVDLTKQYSISEAVAKAKECATAKFDKVTTQVRLGVDPVMLTSR
jgi:hypothetical protein